MPETMDRVGRQAALVPVAAHVGVAAIGVAVLVLVAVPVSSDADRPWPGAGTWVLLAASAVLCGLAGGAVEAVLLARGHRRSAVAPLLGAAIPALWMPVLSMGRWTADQADEVLGVRDLLTGIAGWAMFLVVVTAVAAVGGLAARRGAPGDLP